MLRILETILETTMRINYFQYEVMSAKRYPLTPYGDIIIVIAWLGLGGNVLQSLQRFQIQ